MTLRFSWEWTPASDVVLPELAATWCRLRIDLGAVPVTLVEERDGSGGPRHGIEVAAYPLAEHLAVNWWRLAAQSHHRSGTGVRLVAAGSGFAWPDLTLHNDSGVMWATLRRRDQEPEHVRFLTEARIALDADETLEALARFVDGTVRMLEDRKVTGTLLQDAWAATQ